ncbi:MAG: CidA/LrgA family protein [Lawsonibacter sp.]
MAELAIIFGICLFGEGIAALLPIPLPASVISLLLLLALLLSGVIKERHIGKVCPFLIGNMAFFFVAPCVGLIEHLPTLAACLIPFLLIAICTTPIVYAVTAWTVRLMMTWMRTEEDSHG